MAAAVIHFVVLLTHGFRLGIEIPEHFRKSCRKALRWGVSIRTQLLEIDMRVSWYKGSAYIEGSKWREFCAIYKLRAGEALAFTHLGHSAFSAQVMIPKCRFPAPTAGTRPLVSRFSKVIGKSSGLGCRDPRLCRLYIPAAVWRSNCFHKGRQNIAKLKYRSMEPLVVELKVYPQYGSNNGGVTIALTKGWHSFCSQIGLKKGDKCSFTIMHTMYGEDNNEVLIEVNNIVKKVLI